VRAAMMRVPALARMKPLARPCVRVAIREVGHHRIRHRRPGSRSVPLSPPPPPSPPRVHSHQHAPLTLSAQYPPQVRAEATSGRTADDVSILHAMPQFQVSHYSAASAASPPADVRRAGHSNSTAAAGLPRFPLSPDGKVLLKAMPRSLMQEWVAELQEKPGVSTSFRFCSASLRVLPCLTETPNARGH
jgi:hypothetical protein